MKRILTAVALGAACIGVGAARAQDSPLPPETRWAILIDAADAKTLNDAGTTLERSAAAREKFCQKLTQSGVPADHIFVYSVDAADEARRPTQENILAVLDALRYVDNFVQLDQDDSESRRWRGDDVEAPCEVQLYVIAGGVSSEENGRTRNFVAPCDAPLAEISGADDERLIDVAEIEKALTQPEGYPIERVFLSINFWSTEEKRGGGSASNLNDVDLKTVGVRSSSDDGEIAVAKGFSYVRLLTRNARFDETNVDSFYSAFANGIEGYADVARNGDGWVDALELAEYVRDNAREGTVELFYNGSASYSLAVAERQNAEIPREIFAEIEKELTAPKNAALRESAKKRKNRAPVRKTKLKEESANDAGTRGAKRGVMR